MNDDFTNEDFDRALGRSESQAPFETSESIDAIGAALAKAQLEMGKAMKDSANPFFKSHYADLASVQNAALPALNHAGIAVIQSPSKQNASVVVTTLLVHSSGQWVRGQLTLTPKQAHNPQADGACITYARRYALSAILGIAADEDDDGNAAVEARRKAKHSPDFKDGKTKFMFPRLKEIGLTMDEVNAYTDYCKRPRLSGLNKGDADKLLAGLSASGSDIRNHFDAWRANRG